MSHVANFVHYCRPNVRNIWIGHVCSNRC